MKLVLTGANGGIGMAIAVKFLKQSWNVVGIDVDAPAHFSHPRYTHLQADVRGKLPAIDDVNVLITAAGIQLPEEDAIDVNLKGVVNAVETYAFQPAIRSVLNIASASARNGAEFPLYVASKAGVVGYTKNVALRLARFGATCNTLSPGGVVTASNAPVLEDDALRAAVYAESLLGKWADPEEIAEWAYFLTVVNKSMTGEDVLVDNGEILKSNFIWPKK